MGTATTSDDSFEADVLSANELVLVDFWAEWCQPCKQIAPILDEISSEMAGSIKIAKINIDENPQTPSKYGIRAIPTLMLFKNGEIAGTQVGVHPKSRLVEWINNAA